MSTGFLTRHSLVQRQLLEPSMGDKLLIKNETIVKLSIQDGKNLTC